MSVFLTVLIPIHENKRRSETCWFFYTVIIHTMCILVSCCHPVGCRCLKPVCASGRHTPHMHCELWAQYDRPTVVVNHFLPICHTFRHTWAFGEYVMLCCPSALFDELSNSSFYSPQRMQRNGELCRLMVPEYTIRHAHVTLLQRNNTKVMLAYTTSVSNMYRQDKTSSNTIMTNHKHNKQGHAHIEKQRLGSRENNNKTKHSVYLLYKI